MRLKNKNWPQIVEAVNFNRSLETVMLTSEIVAIHDLLKLMYPSTTKISLSSLCEESSGENDSCQARTVDSFRRLAGKLPHKIQWDGTDKSRDWFCFLEK
jgi:hypothetical protein